MSETDETPTVDLNMRTPLAPKGMGLFLRAYPSQPRLIDERVKRMADNGITWAAIGALWQKGQSDGKADFWINPPERCHVIAECMEAHGMHPYLWGYPWKMREIAFGRAMRLASAECVRGVLIDPEKGLKDKSKKLAIEAGERLFWEMVKVNPYWAVGFTSYGLPKGHPTFPWDAFFESGGFDPLKECDFGCPQLYDEEPEHIARGLREYRALGTDVLVPAFGTYKFSKNAQGEMETPRMNPDELRTHLQRFFDLRDEFRFEAMIGWSETQVRDDCWSVLSEFAARL